jgi:two-component system, LytTR family, response regulator LytT
MISALVVDDEAPARSELRYLLSQHPDVEVVGEAGTAADADRLLRGGGYDVVFLDVELPGPSGVELAPLARAAVVFVTAHERYAVDAFAVEAFDYLLKPVDPDRLARVLERLRAALPGEPPPLAKIAVVAPGGTELLDFDQVYYVQADGDYSRVHTYDRSYLSTSALGELAQRLGPGFARVHRSYVVNLAKVSGIRRASPDRFRLQLADASGTELDVARRQSRELRGRLGL